MRSPLPPQDRPVHVSRVRVRYADTDRMGVAYYANYLVWFEVARTDFLREQGLRYRDLEEAGVFLPVGEAHVRMLAPARYDDELRVECWVQEVRSRHVVFGYRIATEAPAEPPNKGNSTVATGSTTLVSTSPQMRPQALPRELRTSLDSLCPSRLP